MKRKTIAMAVALIVGVSTLTGCMGQMATAGLVTKFNLKVVDNRYGREGLFLLLSPVYGIASVADLFIFNTIEFWTGKNPISGKSPAVVDIPADSLIKVNDQLDKSMTQVPLQSNNRDIESATLKQIDDNTMQMDITYLSGERATLRGEKQNDEVAFYLDDQYVTTVSNLEMERYLETASLQ
ncbi:DUF3332 domain-containing protein [Vibrio fluvialis]|nr:DUF3332 domain-containing protein [Vibrio fluvialis]